MFRRKRREVPGLNTSSTADISFMLLIFFLVTTSMETDKGMQRQMPPYIPDQHKVQRDVERNTVVTLHLMKDGKLSVSGALHMEEGAEQTYSLPLSKAESAKLRRQLKEFIATVGPTHVIEVKTDRDADYESYFSMQDNIVRSYHELKDAQARKLAGCTYEECPKDIKDKILSYYPQRITERLEFP